MPKLDIQSMPRQKLLDFMRGLGQPPYRAEQVFSWLHQKHVCAFAEMTDLPHTLRALLEEACYINSIRVKKRLVSSLDNTVKYLYELLDGNRVETVRMRYRHGYSLCVSTQAGCRMGCGFCASAMEGLSRNLTAGEMLGQVYESGRDGGLRISSVVLMGMGEPLDNFENVLDFLRILSDPKGLGLGPRHISLSTCGLVEGIRRLQAEKLQITLSVSLHAPNDEIRNAIMPVNRRWPLAELLQACKEYFAVTGRRVSFEYALIDGINDKPEHARELAARLLGQNCHVNLIPLNAVRGKTYQRGKVQSVRGFQRELERHGITATVRRELGSDINAACGQLRQTGG